MFSSVTNFYRRNRRKIWVTGAIVGCTYAAGKYIAYKIDEWQNARMDELQTSAKKQFHFESLQKTCTVTFVSFLPNIRNIIMEKLNTEQLLEILKMKPDNKLEIWNDLKVLSLTRILSSVISNVLLLVILKVKMNIIGPYVFTTMLSQSNDVQSTADPSTSDDQNTTSDDLNSTDNYLDIPGGPNKEMRELQLRYLNNVRYFVEEKMPALIDDCQDVVEQCLSKISLKDKLSHNKLKEICKDAVTKLKAKHASLNDNKHEFCVYLIDPTWTDLDNNDTYSRLILETVSILEGIDCSLLMDTCLSLGLDTVLDAFEDQFITYSAPKSDVTVESCLKEDFKSTVLPVPKIIPILNSQIHEIFKAGSNDFLDVLYSQDLVRQMTRNVYESICKEFS